MEDRLLEIKMQFKFGNMPIVNILWLIETVEQQRKEIEELKRQKEFWYGAAKEWHTAFFASLNIRK